MGVIAKGVPRGCQGLFTPVSLGYPLSVFNKNVTLKRLVKRHIATWPFKNGNECREEASNIKQNNSWLCGMGGICCHAMLCMHVLDSRRCPVHCEHENSGAEPSARGTKQWWTRTGGQRCGQICCRSGVSWLVGLAGLSSALPPSRMRALSASAMYILTNTLEPILGQG